MADEACGCDLSCDLPEAARSERAAEIREALLVHVARRESLDGGFAWEFTAQASREHLERIVALERDCCGGLEFETGEAAESGALRLEVRGPGAEIWALLLAEES